METRPTTFACPWCGYPLEGAGKACPECGHISAQEDFDLFARRTLFLELTRGSGILFFVILGGMALAGPGLIGLIPGVLVLGAGYYVGRSAPGLYGRLTRRVWMRNAVWLLLPWLILGGMILWVSLYALPMGARLATSWWLVIFEVPKATAMIYGTLIPFAIAGCAVLWRWQWRRTCRIAGLPDKFGKSVQVRRAFVYAFLLPTSVAILICLVVVIPFWMDRLMPGWDMPK